MNKLTALILSATLSLASGAALAAETNANSTDNNGPANAAASAGVGTPEANQNIAPKGVDSNDINTSNKNMSNSGTTGTNMGNSGTGPPVRAQAALCCILTPATRTARPLVAQLPPMRSIKTPSVKTVNVLISTIKLKPVRVVTTSIPTLTVPLTNS